MLFLSVFLWRRGVFLFVNLAVVSACFQASARETKKHAAKQQLVITIYFSVTFCALRCPDGVVGQVTLEEFQVRTKRAGIREAADGCKQLKYD